MMVGCSLNPVKAPMSTWESVGGCSLTPLEIVREQRLKILSLGKRETLPSLTMRRTTVLERAIDNNGFFLSS